MSCGCGGWGVCGVAEGLGRGVEVGESGHDNDGCDSAVVEYLLFGVRSGRFGASKAMSDEAAVVNSSIAISDGMLTCIWLCTMLRRGVSESSRLRREMTITKVV